MGAPYEDSFDVAIIGAGLHGIAMARFWLEIHPDARLVILECDTAVGGVWSRTRTFDDFWLQSPQQLDFFSDFALQLPDDVQPTWGTFPSKYISEYLEAYVKRPIYSGRSLHSRIWFNTKVSSLVKDGDIWKIAFTRDSTCSSIHSAKVAVATGLSSQPNLPAFVRYPGFSIPFLHHRDFGRNCKLILADSSPYKNLTVLGGGKSAVDLITSALRTGSKKVNWVIRKSGDGPGIFMYPESKRYINSGCIAMTRVGTGMSVSGWCEPEWQPEANEIHKSEDGRRLLKQQIQMRDKACSDFAGYHNRPGALPCFRDLAPNIHGSAFWQSAPTGSISHEDFWDLVSQRVQVYRGEITGHTSDSLILDDGRKVQTDFMLCGTGWSSEYPFISSELAYKLGLPHDPILQTAEETKIWKDLTQEADTRILERYPILQDGPPVRPRQLMGQGKTPVRLYKAIAPLTDQSILFLGRCRVLTNYVCAEAQAIWATALWDGNVRLPEAQNAKRAVAYMNQFSRRRYPSRGGDGVNFHLDVIWYLDSIIREAGLSSHRKSWWSNKEEPLSAEDLADCKDEYFAKYTV